MQAIVDRIINRIVILELESGEIIHLPQTLFDFPVRSQMVIDIFISVNMAKEQELNNDIKYLKKKIIDQTS